MRGRALATIGLLFCGAICAEELNPALLGSNPSFEIGISFNPDSKRPVGNGCQATLIQRTPSRLGSRCTFVTAAHCLNLPGHGTPRLIFTADFGVISDFEIVYRGDFQSIAEEDLALVNFEQGCESSSDAFMVPLGELPATSVDANGMPLEIHLASRAFKRLFSGKLSSKYNQNKKMLTLLLGHGEVNGMNQSFAAFPGDSGGGVFRRTPAGKLELLGVLSLGIYHDGVANRRELDELGAVEAHFVTDTSWIEEKLLEAVKPLPAGLGFDLWNSWPKMIQFK